MPIYPHDPEHLGIFNAQTTPLKYNGASVYRALDRNGNQGRGFVCLYMGERFLINATTEQELHRALYALTNGMPLNQLDIENNPKGQETQ